MTVGALILAGGSGERMRRPGQPGEVPKPLREVRGASLLERNVCALIGAGLRAIWVACRVEQHAIQHAIGPLAVAARARGVAVRLLTESTPLGTIGAAGLLRDQVDTLVTVNADNLTALAIDALLAHHSQSGAALTLATHDHATRLPYGAIDADGDRVTAYREKPSSITRIASAVCVLGAPALAALTGRAGVPELTTRMLDAGHAVRAYHHDAPWIDVNEPDDLVRAAALVAAHDRLECWAQPDLEVVGAIVRDGDHLLLERRANHEWDTPGGKLEPGESPAHALIRELREELGVEVTAGPALTRFDTLEIDGRALRHHVFAPAVRRADVTPREGQTLAWFPIACLPDERAQVVVRSLAAEVR